MTPDPREAYAMDAEGYTVPVVLSSCPTCRSLDRNTPLPVLVKVNRIAGRKKVPSEGTVSCGDVWHQGGSDIGEAQQ